MPDVLTTAQRSLNMSRIRGRNTGPEMLLRRGLHARGLRFRLCCRQLPGSPDLVFPRYRTVIFVHGCFWHGHECSAFRWPKTRPEFWAAKIEANRERDYAAMVNLLEDEWRVMTVWECALRGRTKLNAEDVLNSCDEFVRQRIKGVTTNALVIQP